MQVIEFLVVGGDVGPALDGAGAWAREVLALPQPPRTGAGGSREQRGEVRGEAGHTCPPPRQGRATGLPGAAGGAKGGPRGVGAAAVGAGALRQGQAAGVRDVVQHRAWGVSRSARPRLGIGRAVTGGSHGEGGEGPGSRTVPRGQEDLPGGQKQPSTQWSSQSWDRSGLEQVSAHGEPHSWCCRLRGHARAAGRGQCLAPGSREAACTPTSRVPPTESHSWAWEALVPEAGACSSWPHCPLG